MIAQLGPLDPYGTTERSVRNAEAGNHISFPGIDVWFSPDDSDRAEADIFGTRDGQVICGEVKTRVSRFTSDQIARDVDLSTLLKADVHVRAATDNIPD